MAGREEEAACNTTMTYTHWDGQVEHPKVFGPGEVRPRAVLGRPTPRWHMPARTHTRTHTRLPTHTCAQGTLETLSAIRGGECSPGALVTASRRVLEQLGRSAAVGDSFDAPRVRAGVAATDLLPPACPLFARKVAPEAAGEWLELLRPVMAAWQ